MQLSMLDRSKGVKNMQTKEQILDMIVEEDIEFIRLQFTDMFGNLRNIAVTASQAERVLNNKYQFNASDLFGDSENDEELYLYPDLDTFVILPWRPQHGKVARLLCDICSSEGEKYQLDPRGLLKKAVDEVNEAGYSAFIDPECEFFLFHTDENGNPTTLTHEQASYLDVGPIDLGENTRRDMVFALEDMGFEIESSHHEKAPAQHEIDFKETSALPAADAIITFKNAVRSVAKRQGLHATFMPKPMQNEQGSGMHLKVSLYKDDKDIFNSESGVSDEARWFIGGIMKHARAMCAVTNPLVNSYKRFESGFDAPCDIVWTKKNVNALVRLCSRKGDNTKVELRFPDPSANPYLSIAIILMAGLDGIKNKIEPDEPVLSGYDNTDKHKLPETLREAVNEFKNDELMKACFGEKFVELYSNAKMEEWHDFMRRVSDWELEKYLYRT